MHKARNRNMASFQIYKAVCTQWLYFTNLSHCGTEFMCSLIFTVHYKVTTMNFHFALILAGPVDKRGRFVLEASKKNNQLFCGHKCTI